MSKYLIDKKLANLTITEEAILKINEEIYEIVNAYNKDLQKEQQMFVEYTINFDSKIYKITDIDEVIKHFKYAKNITKFVFNVISETNISIEIIFGTLENTSYLHLNEDSKSSISVYSTDKYLVECAFNKLLICIKKYSNNHNKYRNTVMILAAQIIAVISCVIFSIFLTKKTSHFFNIEFSILIAFCFWLLIFSNLWDFIRYYFVKTINKTFPIISFKETKSLSKLVNVIKTFIIVPLVLWLLTWLINLVITNINFIFNFK